jgi:hypothetical protein
VGKKGNTIDRCRPLHSEILNFGASEEPDVYIS